MPENKNKSSDKEFFKIIGAGLKILLALYLPIFAFWAFVFYWIATDFMAPKKDTTIFLSVGFAMLIGLASVCFSWVKTIEESDERAQKIKKDIKICGESFFLTALYLIIASALKYVSIRLSTEKYQLFIFFGKVSYWIFYIIIVTVLIYFTVAFARLLHLLFFRVENDIRGL